MTTTMPLRLKRLFNRLPGCLLMGKLTNHARLWLVHDLSLFRYATTNIANPRRPVSLFLSHANILKHDIPGYFISPQPDTHVMQQSVPLFCFSSFSMVPHHTFLWESLSERPSNHSYLKFPWREYRLPLSQVLQTTHCAYTYVYVDRSIMPNA